jgi:predicted GH43/DUF377 family glycosyl hydrolase
MIPIQRTNIRIQASPHRVVLRFLNFGSADRFQPVIGYVLQLDERAAAEQLQAILDEFEERHLDLKAAFIAHYNKLITYVSESPSLEKRLLIGAFFTLEYSIEAAALFNPSIIPHPDQTGLAVGELRFIMSLRATGEGHISSIVFQTGRIGAEGAIYLDPRAPLLTCGSVDENENLVFGEDTLMSSRVIFPRSPAESHGMEDARFVQFHAEEGSRYLGTYTAYDGQNVRPYLIETQDFLHFTTRPFFGEAASGKGMALFPEKIKGKYAMVGRQGGRCLSMMYSDDLYLWEDYQEMQQPQRAWEFLQMGNCGSPVKTPQGWLLLTHAVGPMRKYVISASLLDLDHPEIVLASLDHPLLSPNAEEREGYVPNVLYTCGMLEHNGNLIIPYAMSDSAVSFAVVERAALLQELVANQLINQSSSQL